MKKIIIVISMLMISGCAIVQPIVDRFTIAPFDSNEYALLNKIRTTSQLIKPYCANYRFIEFTITEIYEDAILLQNYSEYLPKNQQTIQSINLLYQMIHDIKKRYSQDITVSETYCQLKLNSIEEASISIQKSIAKRPRP